MRAHDCVQERGDLQRGQSVTLLTGRVVHSHEVMAPGVPGPCLVVVDCPTESHLDILASQAGPLTKWTVSCQRRALSKGGQQLRQHSLAWGCRRGSHILGGVIQRWAIPQRVLERGKPQLSVRGQCKWLVKGLSHQKQTQSVRELTRRATALLLHNPRCINIVQLYAHHLTAVACAG